MESHEPEQSKKLFIGGLPYNATEGSLKKCFEQWGEVVDAVVIRHPITKKSRGFGFVTYSQLSMVEEAMSNRPHNINGREVETKLALSRDDIDEPNIKAAVKKLFVFGIKEQSEDDILEYFEKFGNIIGIKIVNDKDSGKRKGYGFIEYDNTDSVDKAVSIKNHQVDGERLNVKKAVSRINFDGRGGHGSYGSRGGLNRSSWIINSQYEQRGEYHYRSNGWSGYNGNCEMSGGYISFEGCIWYRGSACVNETNCGRAWQVVPQRWDYNNPIRGNQRSGCWRGSQQLSNNLSPNQSYGQTKSNYTSNNDAAPYENSGAGWYANSGYADNGQ